jgi:hypothetical protein
LPDPLTCARLGAWTLESCKDAAPSLLARLNLTAIHSKKTEKRRVQTCAETPRPTLGKRRAQTFKGKRESRTTLRPRGGKITQPARSVSRQRIQVKSLRGKTEVWGTQFLIGPLRPGSRQLFCRAEALSSREPFMKWLLLYFLGIGVFYQQRESLLWGTKYENRSPIFI